MLLSIYFRKQGPQRPHYDWEDEPDEEDETVENDATIYTTSNTNDYFGQKTENR